MVNTLFATTSPPRINGASAKAGAAGVWDTRVHLRWDAAAVKITAAATAARGGGPVGGGGAGGASTVTDRKAAKILMQVRC